MCCFNFITALWDRYYYHHPHFTDEKIGSEKWSHLSKIEDCTADGRAKSKPDSLNLEPVLLTTLILSMRNGKTSQIITSSYLPEFPFLLNEHTNILIYLVFIIRGSQEQPHYVLKNHRTCWYPWRSVSCSCISFWICFNFSSVTGLVVSPTCNHLCFLFVSPKLFNLRKCRNCFIWGKKWSEKE